MKNFKTLDDRFELGIKLRNEGKLNEAVEVFKEIIDLYIDHPNIGGMYTILGGIYQDLGNRYQAKSSYIEATKHNPKSELASLGLYLSFTELEEYEEAINELDRYLSKYEPRNYKITLLELLGDLEDGYALTYKKTILRLANKHKIQLGQG